MKLKIVLAGNVGLMLLIVGVLYGFSPDSGKKLTDIDKANATVEITNFSKNSGGSGVILSSDRSHSIVLTNSHVCEIIKKGGLVISESNKDYIVTSYKQATNHDLCLIYITANMGINTAVADHPPSKFEPSIVSGHPSLYPTVISEGKFSSHLTIEVQVGSRPCTEEDLKNGYILYCMFTGGMPLVKTYDSQLISSLIKPGSSGSAVFNSSGEIAGLVFAGQNDVGYGFIVPLEYIIEFLKAEWRTPFTPVSNSVSL